MEEEPLAAQQLPEQRRRHADESLSCPRAFLRIPFGSSLSLSVLSSSLVSSSFVLWLERGGILMADCFSLQRHRASPRHFRLPSRIVR